MVDALITFAAGLAVTYVGWRAVPVGPDHLYWVEWHRKYGRFMRIAGPLMVVSAIIQGLLH